MTDWKARQNNLSQTLSQKTLPPEERHAFLMDILRGLSDERKEASNRASGSEGHNALVNMSLNVAREINALRKTHPEVIKQSQPPPPPAPVIKAAPPPQIPAEPRPSFLSRLSGAASWVSKATTVAVEDFKSGLQSLLPKPKTLSTFAAQFAGVATVAVAFSTSLNQDMPPPPVKAPVQVKAIPTPVVVAKALPSVERVAIAPALPAAAPKPSVGQRIKQKLLGMDEMFHREEELEAALDKIGQLPPDEAFSKAVMVESRDRQHDDKGRVVTSPKGATGAAQVMPDTAKLIAVGCTGKPLDVQRFKNDKAYNKSLGRCYYKDQYETYRDNPIMAALAYNMGPGNVDKHIAKVGDPTKGEIEMVDFIKKIRITETRHYVLHMLKQAGFMSPAEPAGTRKSAPRSDDSRKKDTPQVQAAFEEVSAVKPVTVLPQLEELPVAVPPPIEVIHTVPEAAPANPVPN